MGNIPTIYFCRNSYGIDNFMTECTHDLDSNGCSRHCKKFKRRDIPKNEDERMLQSTEWD